MQHFFVLIVKYKTAVEVLVQDFLHSFFVFEIKRTHVTMHGKRLTTHAPIFYSLPMSKLDLNILIWRTKGQS